VNRSVFIGAEAGNNETGTEKLYIENSNSSSPLIYGQFDNDKLGINTSQVGSRTLTVGGDTYTDSLATEKIIFGDGTSLTTATASPWSEGSTLSYHGQVAIDTTYVPAGYSLSVNGDVIAEQVDVLLSGTWPDYVFGPAYELQPLPSVAAFIDKNGHLPNMPSAKEMTDKGVIDLQEMNLKLLEKVEELTLHLIQQNRRIEELEQVVSQYEDH